MPAAEATRRQTLMKLLAAGEWTFEELRRELEIPRRLLESELRHVERTLRARGGRLELEPPRCLACGFVFDGRAARGRYSAPSRCPRCKSERVGQPRLSAEPGRAGSRSD